ncbi:TPR end-of-group domain-containing protein [Ekhidna sp.]|uniref:TPR end-of-group domain-containing protein n=1 Tax=Ekhidna sp. TaxID=2608089 RepID=UPI003B50F4D5
MKNIIYILIILSPFMGSSQSLRELYQEGAAAYETKDFELFKKRMYSIDSMRPNYPAVVYNLAAGYALTGEKEKSIDVLSKYILMDATQDFGNDEDFKSLLNDPDFIRIVGQQVELTRDLEISQKISFPILSSHPESITYSEDSKTYYLGGVRDGGIFKIKNNKVELFAESAKNSWCVMGLEIAPNDKVLWVCTASMNNYQNYNQKEEGYSSVLKYDLKAGELLETYALPGGHVFGDLITDKKGNVYISDGTSNKLYWISKEKNELEEFVDLSGRVFNLQGLSFDDDQKNIYLSDYIEGIYKLNMESKKVIKLEIEVEDVLIKGIDGLYFIDNSLIGLHNGTNPNRVIKYTLSSDQRAIIGKNILAQGGSLGEPTQGVWIDGQLHFIANSPWGAYDQDGNFNPEGETVVIGIIK